MYALFKKEINNFLSSLIGIMVVVVFLLITGLFLWVFRSDFNVMTYGYASLDEAEEETKKRAEAMGIQISYGCSRCEQPPEED